MLISSPQLFLMKNSCLTLVIALLLLSQIHTQQSHQIGFIPFTYSHSLSLSTLHLSDIIPESLYVYSNVGQENTINIQALDMKNQGSGNLQTFNTITESLTDIWISPDGLKIIILTQSPYKVYSLARQDLSSQFGSPQEVFNGQKFVIFCSGIYLNNVIVFLHQNILYIFEFDFQLQIFNKKSEYTLQYEGQPLQLESLEKIGITLDLQYIYVQYYYDEEGGDNLIYKADKLEHEFIAVQSYYSQITQTIIYAVRNDNGSYTIKQYDFESETIIAQLGIKDQQGFYMRQLMIEFSLKHQYILITINLGRQAHLKIIQISRLRSNVINNFYFLDFEIYNGAIGNFKARRDGRGYLQIQNNQLNTKQFYYQCHYTCSVCQSGFCSCNINLFESKFDNAEKCKCIQGYQRKQDFQCCLSQCEPCPQQPCCDPNMFRQLQKQECVCMQKYYEVGKDMCLPCHYSCKTCLIQESCDTCQPTNFREPIEGKCECMERYYDAGSQMCEQCHYSCLTCLNLERCDSCDPKEFRQLNSGPFCQCFSGYFENNAQICEPCIFGCDSCFDSQQCQKCEATRQLIGSQCLCRDGYFHGGEVKCKKCDPLCSVCENLDKCQQCYTYMHRELIDSKCQCLTGYFNDGQLICKQCSQTCLTCLDSNSCQSCDQNEHRHLIGSQCQCIDGYYEDEDDQLVCKECFYFCKTCLNSDTCESCDQDMYRQLIDSSCSCMDGYYDFYLIEQCFQCSKYCKTCSNSYTCDSCNSEMHRELINNQCQCMNGYFDNGQVVCHKCQQSCKKCSNPTICEACYDKQYLDPTSNICKDCDYTCKSCLNDNTCQTCDSTKNRILSDQSCQCLNGYFDNGAEQQCQACQENCETCQNKDKCTTCKSKDSGGEQCQCIIGYFQNKSQQCEPCHHSCMTCSISSQCDTCSSQNHRYFDPLTKKCLCQDGYYDDEKNQQCSTCHYSCFSCSAEEQCVCSSDDLREKDSLSKTCKCSEGYSDDGTNSLCFEKMVEINNKKAQKIAGKNQVKLSFDLDIPMKISPQNCLIKLKDSNQLDQTIQWNIIQRGQSSFDLFLTYRANIQNKLIKIVLYGIQERRMLQNITPIYSGEIQVSTYPPAQLTENSIISTYESLRSGLLVTSAILMILSLLSIFIPQTQFYGFKYGWTPAKIFIALGVSPESVSGWLKLSLEPVSQTALVLGFDAYECCEVSQNLKYTTKVSQNAGIPICILIFLWLLYVVVIVLQKKKKISKLMKMYYRLFLLSIQLLVLPHWFFVPINAFYYAGTNQADANNIVLACLLFVWLLLFTIFLIFQSRKLQPEPLESNKQQEEQKQSNPEKNQSPRRWFNISYYRQLSLCSKFAKYYIPFIVIKLFVFGLFCSVLQGQGFLIALYLLLLLTDVILEACFLLAVRPFRERRKLVEELGLLLGWLILYLLMCVYAAQNIQKLYSPSLETGILVIALIMVIVSIILLLVDMVMIIRNMLDSLRKTSSVSPAGHSAQSIDNSGNILRLYTM